MADEQKTEVTPTPEEKGGAVETKQPEVIQLTSEQLNARLERERAKYSDYDKIKSEHEQLLADMKAREEAELSELDKAKKRQEELESELTSLKPYKEREEQRQAKILEQVEKELESDITDEDKLLVDNITDPDGKLALVKRLKAANNKHEPPKNGYSPANQKDNTGLRGKTRAERDRLWAGRH